MSYRLFADHYETLVIKDENDLPDEGWIACINPKTGKDSVVSRRFGWRYYFEEVA